MKSILLQKVVGRLFPLVVCICLCASCDDETGSGDSPNEEEAYPEETTTTKRIASITCRYLDNAELSIGSSAYESKWERTFSYDAEGRVARIVWEDVPMYGSAETHTMTFDYTITGEIAITDKVTGEYSGGYEKSYVALLNDAGNVTTLQADENTDSYDAYQYFTYTDGNRLTQWKNNGTYGYYRQMDYSYSNGLLTDCQYYSYSALEEYALDADKAYANAYPNNAPIDIMALFEDDDSHNFMAYIGRMGKTSDYLPEVVPCYLIYDDNDSSTEMGGYYEPGVTIQKSYYSTNESEADLSVEYTFDADNCLTEVRTERAYTLNQTTYTVTVSNEYIDPDFPERGYKYTTSDYVTTTVDSDTNVYVWTITYVE